VSRRANYFYIEISLFFFSHRLQNETKNLMQQTNDALLELNNTRVLNEADQVKNKIKFYIVSEVFIFLSIFRDVKKL